MVNGLQPETVVEVGCGLGEILRYIEAPHRYGYDIDEGAIRAGRFLQRRKIRFFLGNLSAVKIDPIDVLILVNWIHELSPAELETQLSPLLSRTRYLLLDAIDPDGPPSYRFKHDFSFLNNRTVRLKVVRPSAGGRSFHLLRLIA